MTNPTRMDDIADHIADLELNEKAAAELLAMMADYETKFHGSFRGLMRAPGFRKIWTALEEAAASSARHLEV